MSQKIIKAYLLITFALAASFSFAQKVMPLEIQQVKKNFQLENHIYEPVSQVFPLISNTDTLALVFNYPHAFVVISTYKNLPPIKAYSVKNRFPIKSLNENSSFSFSDMLIDDYKNFIANTNTSFTKQNNNDWKNIYSPITKDTKVQYGPLLDNIYGQTKCKDENNKTINVTNLYTPNNYAVGCVAITFVELLQYYEWPRIGTGSHSYNDTQGSTKGLHSVRFDKKYYNWGLVKDKYYKVPTTTAERNELGNLAYHCAVSIDMDFEYNGATSNINRIPNAANKYFRYTAKHIKKSVSGFWAQIDTNIINGFPVQFAIYTTSGAGHAIVCDGLKPDVPANKQYYHLNMGWWGSSNAWYLIQGSFNAGGYTNITAAVVDMFPIPELEQPKLDTEDEVVELVWYYPTRIAAQDFEIQVKVGAKNWETISDSISGQTLDYKYTSTELHRFRVRAKMGGKWNALGYSNNMTINIQKELDNANTEELKVYPTLVSNRLIIEYPNLETYNIEIYNSVGMRVYSYQGQANSMQNKRTINMQNLYGGIYFIRVFGDDIDQTTKIFKN